MKWKDAKGKSCDIVLKDSKQRRLFAFLLGSKIREPKGLPDYFVADLSTRFGAQDDPADTAAVPATSASSSGPWRLESIETEGFGGLNTWGGPPFRHGFDGESLLVEGPNGSGKSSLVGAVLWALLGERPRDQTHSGAHEAEPVFGADDKQAGKWPPIACYPPTVAGLGVQPNVRVALIFLAPGGLAAKIERTLVGDKMQEIRDPALQIPAILLETGLLMPARMAQLRLKEEQGGLTDSVQKLTGLDELIEIGELAKGLCHKSQEYLSYARRNNLDGIKGEFDQALEAARTELKRVSATVPPFLPNDTDDSNGAMAALGRELSDRAVKLAKIISNDLAEGLDLADAKTQKEIVVAISAARDDLSGGLEALPTWKALQLIANALNSEALDRLSASISKAQRDLAEAKNLHEKSKADSRSQLKAVAARWHAQHSAGPIQDCPLCAQPLKDLQALATELERLKTAGEAAGRDFSDNLNAIRAELEASLPEPLKKILSDVLNLKPRDALVEDIRSRFIRGPKYRDCLAKFASIIETALSHVPVENLAPVVVPSPKDLPDGSRALVELIAIAERASTLAAWFRAEKAAWLAWWRGLVTPEPKATEGEGERPGERPADEKPPSGESNQEGLSHHLLRLSDALDAAEPFRTAAEAMRKAWKFGKEAAKIAKEQTHRQEIADSIEPLKELVVLAQAVARQAIEDLSGKIGAVLDRLYLTDRLRFRDARQDKKEGVVVRSGFDPDLSMDATLVANASWLRAVLWAFLFSLREEAVEQLGDDPFPLLIFDDPQATFDAQHRHRWAQYIADLQKGPSKAQIVLTTHDETFIEVIKVEGVTGRQALIASAGSELARVGIFEGGKLDRKYAEAKRLKTPESGRDYMIAVRIYVEGMLKLMLRGEDPDVPNWVLGRLREEIEKLHKAGRAPWDKTAFKTLAGSLDKGLPAIKHIESAHHTTGLQLGMAEAAVVEEHWRKLRRALERGFWLTREHWSLHGGLTALHGTTPTLTLPEGYQAKVRAIPLREIGRAAALTDGRSADGRVDMHLTEDTSTKIILGFHYAFRLTAPTLEPTARMGDVLLVKEHGEPSPKSLVVVLSEDRILARRFEIADNSSDLAVLTAQAINPRQIAPPIVAHKATMTLHKVVGVLFDDLPVGSSAQLGMEVCDCGGEATLSRLTSNALGLVKVDGQSAEPLALDGQYLIVNAELSTEDALKRLDGRPIIAADTEDNRYFKRLFVTSSDQIVLESLDNGGDYAPIVLSRPGQGSNCLERVWPVAGVLFELPS